MTSEGKITRSLKEISVRFKRRICEKKLDYSARKRPFKSNSFTKFSSMITNLGLKIEFSIFDDSANRSVYYFSSLNRLPELIEYINSSR